jgi:hypothetical protein
MAQETTYRYGPLERGGFMLGLRIPQLLGLVAGGLIALGFLNTQGIGGLLLAALTIALAALLVLVPVRGHTIEEWTPLTVRYLIGRFSGKARFRAQLAQVGHIVRVPDGGLTPETPEDPKSVPTELAGLELVEGELARYQGALMGVAIDRKAKTFTATLRCQGQAFALLGAEEREQRLADYGGVLAALARDDTPLRRVAWIERTLPANGDAMANYLYDNKRPDVSLDAPPPELVSYIQLLGRSPDVAEDHELLFSVQIDAMRASARRAIKRLGGGDLGALAVLANEVGQIADLLDAAGIAVTGVLTRRGLAAAIRNAYDPWGRQQRERGVRADSGIAAFTAGPMARDERWSHIATDGAVHTTLWVAEWPRIDVRATFLQALLMETRTTRSVAMVMELVGPGTAIRKVERAATEADTEASLRGRIGQRTSQRQWQKEQATHRRERELAEGHAEVRFAAYVTVSAQADVGEVGAVDELEAAVSRVELQAKQALVRLERMWGQQAEAFTATLPLCRGLR